MDYRYLHQLLLVCIGSAKSFFTPEYAKLYTETLKRLNKITGILYRPPPFKERNIKELEKLLNGFGDLFKRCFESISSCDFIKLHAMCHIPDDMREFAASGNISANSWEHLHLATVKWLYWLTNRSKSDKTKVAMLRSYAKDQLLIRARKVNQII